MDPVSGVNARVIIEGPRKNSSAVGGGDFADTLKAFYNHVDDQLKTADQKTAEFAVGKNHDIHEVMVASEKAGLSFKLLMQVRNKLLEAYQEIMRMQF